MRILLDWRTVPRAQIPLPPPNTKIACTLYMFFVCVKRDYMDIYAKNACFYSYSLISFNAGYNLAKV